MSTLQRRRQAQLLLGTLAAAIAVTAGIGALVLAVDPAAGLSEALRTGGLAGAAVVALYGLWLNDRRRRLEEDRQVVEEQRLRLEGSRVTDERFARAIELLGHEADQVRVGAMHALVGLARSTPDYTQTVLDVLCAYLRRPFFHHAYGAADHDPDRNDFADPPGQRLTDEQAADDRERQVRLTAQRLLRSLLPAAGSDRPTFDLDLTGAALEYLNLERCAIGVLIARRSAFRGISRLGDAEYRGMVLFSGAVFHGRLELGNSRFRGGLSLLKAVLDGEVDLSGCVLAEFADLRWAQGEQVNLTGTTAPESTRRRLHPDTTLPTA